MEVILGVAYLTNGENAGFKCAKVFGVSSI